MKKLNKKYDYIVVGSGAGGGTLVRELARRGKDVFCIEWGKPVPKLGGKWDCYYFYDFKRLPDMVPSFMQKIPLIPPKTTEGIIMWRAVAAGGSSLISLGNGARCMEDELYSMGVDLTQESEETEQEVGLDFIDERLLSKGSKSIREASSKLGYNMVPMPKYINAKKCVKCHRCLYGCQYGAKWDARIWLDEAAENGAEFMYGTKVLEVKHSNGKVTGVVAKGPDGTVEIEGRTVVLAAGGMATPVVLQQSGIEAGEGFFLDVFWNTYGITKEEGLNQNKEPNMALVALEWFNGDGFLLSPYMNHDRMTRLQEMNPLKALPDSSRMLGMMIKITDDANGRVYPDGKISKPLTKRDRDRLKKGASIAREILVEAGVRPETLFETKVQGAHPGGAAAIGKVVDKDLQTKVDNLFVCDASVFPGQAFNDKDRLPPILTIVALAKRLAKMIG